MDPSIYNVPEDFIIHHIPDELVSVLQTAVLLQVELGINCEQIYDLYPKILTLEERSKQPLIDTSLQSKLLLCPVHIERLIAVVERLGDKAPMRKILEGKPKKVKKTDSY